MSDYANWLYEHTDADIILAKIANCFSESDYEDLLKELADKLLDEEYLAEQNKVEKIGTIYKCDGIFKWIEIVEDDDEDDWDEEDDWEEDEEDY